MKLSHERALDILYLLILVMILAGCKSIINDRDRDIEQMQINNIELKMQFEDLLRQKEIYQEIILRGNKEREKLRQEIEDLRTIRARVTAYAPLDNVSGICADDNPNVTATGKRPSAKYAAADPEKLPYGTKLYIPDYGEVEIQDTGAILRNRKGVNIDVYMDSYTSAMAWGVQELDVVLKR